ncbi:MAG: ribosome maturation factor RimP [Clostridia bacterium]|nr:ribosome maturation factor RimP [Clostridia bacterium]
MANITERVTELIRQTVEDQGVSLWDVRFVKEGASHYLRIYIDKPEGIDINDCTNVSHAIDPLLDEADPIDCAYYLEVCSPGIERELLRDAHYQTALGKTVRIKLYHAIDGQKEFTGILRSFDGSFVLEEDGATRSFERSTVSKIVLADE